MVDAQSDPAVNAPKTKLREIHTDSRLTPKLNGVEALDQNTKMERRLHLRQLLG
jgi:hypothetical protein